MMRRQFFSGAMAVGADAAFNPAQAQAMSYEQAVEQTWRPMGEGGKNRELVRLATLAAMA